MESNQYEEWSAVLEKENKRLISLFEKDLTGKVSPKTIRKHTMNVELFLNDYIIGYEFDGLEEKADACVTAGVHLIGMFISYFYIEKCMFSSPSGIREVSASLKKFYKSMLDHEMISDTDYRFVCDTIKEDKDLWISEYRDFWHEDDDDEFFF